MLIDTFSLIANPAYIQLHGAVFLLQECKIFSCSPVFIIVIFSVLRFSDFPLKY